MLSGELKSWFQLKYINRKSRLTTLVFQLVRTKLFLKILGASCNFIETAWS